MDWVCLNVRNPKFTLKFASPTFELHRWCARRIQAERKFLHLDCWYQLGQLNGLRNIRFFTRYQLFHKICSNIWVLIVDHHHRHTSQLVCTSYCKRVASLERKNSSMELAVIWGNFSCSDLACSDLAQSFGLLWFGSLWFGLLFLSKFLLFFTQYSQLGNSFSTHPNGTNLTKWNFYILFCNNIYISTKRMAQYPF